MTIMDGGLWITWYDLPAEGRGAYLSWLHETYMPKILRRPGILWGAHYAEIEKPAGPPFPRPINHTHDSSVPIGGRYILLFGAEYPAVFGNPVPSALNAALPETSRKMLSMRIGERVNIMAETGRVEGPDAKAQQAGMMPANCIQLGTYNTSWQDEEDMLAWYMQGRLPALRVMPGCVRTRTLVSASGWAKHGVLYEFSSLEIRNKNFDRLKDKPAEVKAWGDQVIPRLVHAPTSPNLACRIWPAMTS